MPFGRIARNLDLRAEARLRMVGQIFKSGLNGKISSVKQNGFELNMILPENDFLDALSIRYIMQNRFFNRNYDLHLEASFPNSGCAEKMDDILIALDYRGSLRIKNANFVLKSGGEQGKAITERLNHPEITGAFLKINFPSFEVRYLNAKNFWRIRATSLIGSSTWLFIPPIFHTIKPSPEECVLIIDLFELTARAAGSRRAE